MTGGANAKLIFKATMTEISCCEPLSTSESYTIMADN